MRVLVRDELMTYERAAFARELSRRGHEMVDEDGDVLITGGPTLAADELDDHPRLRLVVRYARGAADANREHELLASRGIEARQVRGVSAQSTAEHAMAMLLALLRRLPDSANGMLAGRWCQRSIAEAEIRDFGEITLGIVGMGAVGRRIATLARAFGARVLYTKRRQLDRAQEEIFGVRYATLDELVRESDAVCLAARTPKHQQPLLNAERLSQLRRNAVLVSVGGGGDVDLNALHEVIEQRGIRAALDVFPREPWDGRNFAGLESQIILSPHVAGRSRATASSLAHAVANTIASLEENTACNCAGMRITDAVVAMLGSTDILAKKTVRVPARLPHLAHAARRLGAHVEPADQADVDPMTVAPFVRIVARWGTDFAMLDSLLPRDARGSLPGRRLHIRGYGESERRLAQCARVLGMDVIIVESDPSTRMEAILDGFATRGSAEPSSQDWIVDAMPQSRTIPPALADEESAATLALLAAAVSSWDAVELFVCSFILAREGRLD